MLPLWAGARVGASLVVLSAQTVTDSEPRMDTNQHEWKTLW